MSEGFSKYQKEVCDIPEEIPLKTICPACIPNESYVMPDWKNMVGQPFLNEKTCEYMICVTQNKFGNPFVISPSNPFPTTTTGEGRTERRRLMRSYVEPAIRLMLEEYGKLIADQIICAAHQGPSLDGTPADILTKYGNYDEVYASLATDPITGESSKRNSPCAQIANLPAAPILNPENPIDFTREAIKVWSNLPQITNPWALEIYGYPKEWAVTENGGGLLKVLVAIPAYILEKVPDNPTRDDIEEAAVTPVNEVILTVKDLWGQMQRLKTSLWVYSQYQSAFAQIQDGFIYTPVGEDKIDYYASVYSQRIGAFYKTLKHVGRDNGWNIKSNLKSAIRNNARLVKITFDNSDTENPYKVTKIEAKKHGCKYEEWTKGLSKLIGSKKGNAAFGSPFDQTVWNYIAKINEIDVSLQAKKSYPWQDFLIRYTFPLLSVDYGRFGEKALEKSAGQCVANNVKKFGVELRDYMLNESLSISDFIAYEFNKKSCTDFGDLTNEHEVVVEESERNKKRQSIKEAKEQGRKDLQEREKRLIEGYNTDLNSQQTKRIQLFAQKRKWEEHYWKSEEDRWRHADMTESYFMKSDDELLDGIADFEKQIEETTREVSRLKSKIEEVDDSIGKKQIRQAGRQAAARKRNESKNPDPYYKLGYEAALQEFNNQDSLLATLVPKAEYYANGILNMETVEAVDFSDIMTRMTLCNLKSLTIQSVRCLFSGMTTEDALKKIVKMTLSSFDIDVFGFFISNLPPEQQRKLRDAFEEEFKDLPLPWEEGYDPGDMSNTNAYIKYLKKTPEKKESEPKKKESEGPKPEEVVPPEEVVTEVTPEPPVPFPSDEQLKEADASWVAYINRRASKGYSDGKPVKSAWYTFMFVFVNGINDYGEDSFANVTTPYPVDITIKGNPMHYDNYVDWYTIMQSYHQEHSGRTRLMRRDYTVDQINMWTEAYENHVDILKLVSDDPDDLIETVREGGEILGDVETPEGTTAGQALRAARKTWEEEAKTIGKEKEGPENPSLEEKKSTLKSDLKYISDSIKENTLIGRSGVATWEGTKDKWKNLTDKQRWEVAKNEKYSYDENGKQGTYGNALGNIQEMVVKVYIEYMLDLLEIDELMMLLDRFPGSDILYKFVGDITCAYQGMFKPPIESFMSTLTLDVCGEAGVGIGVPGVDKVPDIAGFFDGSVLLVLKKQFASKVEAALTEVVKRLVLKVLESLDSALCKAINVAGITASNMISGKSTPLNEAFAEAFCPDADEDELNDTMNNIFKSSGINGAGVSDKSFNDLYKTINATTSKNEVLGLLTTPPNQMNQKVLKNIGDLVQALHPEFAGVFGNPSQIAGVFGRAGNLIPPELRKFIQDQINTEPDGPVYDSICLTQPELDKWNNDRVAIWTDMGLDEEAAQELINNINNQLGKDADDMLDLLNRGPDGPLSDALNSILDRDPGCVNDKTALIFEDENLQSEKNTLIKSLFENIERTFMSELIRERHAVLNNILRDKNNFRLRKHERRADMPMIFPNYTNSEADWEFREQNSNILVAGRMRKVPILNPNAKPQGNYPETVGIVMREQLDSFTPAFTNSISGSTQKPQVSMSFEDVPGEPNYSFTLEYRLNHINRPSRQIIVTEQFHNKIKKKEAEALGIDYNMFNREVPAVETLNLSINESFGSSRYTDFNYESDKETTPFQALMFSKLLESKIGSSINYNNTLLGTFASINNKVLNFAIQASITNPDGDIPNGFNFGYISAQPLTFEDMWYVNPDADPKDKKTWLYTHLPNEKVLGKSATENPRVHFLDPALHGGNYLFPKIYVEPETYNGWLGMVKTFIPEIEECEQQDNGFLNTTKIAERVKEVENNLPMDERLSLAPDCRIEVPYDKLFSPASHGIMDGVVITTLKLYTTEFILKTLPVFSGIEFSEKNIDSTFLGLLVEQFKRGLVSQDTRWNMIQGYTYYLLFLEQAVQVVQRLINDGLMEKTDELAAAFAEITETQREYNQIKINVLKLKNEDWSEVLDIFRGSAIIGFGEDEWEDEFAPIQQMYEDSGQELLEDIGTGAAVGAFMGGATGINAGVGAGLVGVAGGAAAGAAVGAATNASVHALTKLATKLGFLTPFKLRTARKINSIHQSRSAAEVCLRALMSRELNQLMDKINLNMRPRPHIEDINKYLLSRNGIALGSSTRSGEMVIEKPAVEGSTGFDYGDVFDVVRDPMTENPFDDWEVKGSNIKFSIDPEFLGSENPLIDYVTEGITLQSIAAEGVSGILETIREKFEDAMTVPMFEGGFFYLEKYLRVIEVDGTEQVYNIKEFQDIIKEKIEYSSGVDEIANPALGLYIDPERYVSDYYGNAYVADEELRGSIGIKFGVRLVFCPPALFDYPQPTDREKERTYMFPMPDIKLSFGDTFYEKVENIPIPQVRDRFLGLLNSFDLEVPTAQRAIPVAVYEQDIQDRKIIDLDLEDKNFGEDLKCYIDKLVETEDYQVIFDNCYPVKSFTSLLGVYSYYGFFESIGKAEEGTPEKDEDPAKLREKWKLRVFRDTKRKLRRMFNSTYRTDDDVREERERRSKKDKSDFVKNLLPHSFLNLDSSIQWWQSIRIVDVKPFDADGNECLNAFQKMFR